MENLRWISYKEFYLSADKPSSIIDGIEDVDYYFGSNGYYYW